MTNKTDAPVAEWFAAHIGAIIGVVFLCGILYVVGWIVVGVHFIAKWW